MRDATVINMTPTGHTCTMLTATHHNNLGSPEDDYNGAACLGSALTERRHRPGSTNTAQRKLQACSGFQKCTTITPQSAPDASLTASHLPRRAGDSDNPPIITQTGRGMMSLPNLIDT